MPIYNGVGAWWMPQWMRSQITAWFLRNFDEGLAQNHDLDYWLGERSRIDIDRAFLAAMLAQSDSIRTRAKAITIYSMVRLLGWASYLHRLG